MLFVSVVRLVDKKIQKKTSSAAVVSWVSEQQFERELSGLGRSGALPFSYEYYVEVLYWVMIYEQVASLLTVLETFVPSVEASKRSGCYYSLTY